MIKPQLKYVAFGAILFANITSELNAGIKDGCRTHTYITSLLNCPTVCARSVTVQGECDAWGFFCPSSPGVGYTTNSRGVCVRTKGLGWSCENLVVYSSGSFTCRC